MAKKLDSLTFFFPTYNEEENIGAVVNSASKVLPKYANKWEIIVVNDGSTDNTEEVVKKLEKKIPPLRLVNHKVNQGYGGALKTGFASAKYKWVGFADSDGQFDLEELSKFTEKAESADVIVGYRIKRADPFVRVVLTYGWKTLARILLGLRVRDYSCGFKLIKKEVFEAVQPLEGEEKVTQIEFLVKADRKGFKFAEVGVHHYPRQAGTQTGAKFSVFLKSVIDLLKLWQKLGS